MTSNKMVVVRLEAAVILLLGVMAASSSIAVLSRSSVTSVLLLQTGFLSLASGVLEMVLGWKTPIMGMKRILFWLLLLLLPGFLIAAVAVGLAGALDYFSWIAALLTFCLTIQSLFGKPSQRRITIYPPLRRTPADGAGDPLHGLASTRAEFNAQEPDFVTSDVPGEDPGPTAIVEYEFTPEEGVRVLRWQFSQVVRLRRLVGMATLLAMAGVVLLVLANKSWYLGVIIIGVAILNLLWIGWSYYFATTRAWKKTGAAVGPKTMEFSDANVRVRTKKSDSVNQWTYYSEALERGDMYFLRLGKARAYLPVPKRAFRSIVDEVAFRSMAERHTSVSFTSGHPK